MKLEYPLVTAGYLGIKNEQASLNATFYAEIFSGNYDLSNYIVFLQRVYKMDFFDELFSLENSDVRNMFFSLQQKITNELHISLDEVMHKKDSQRKVLNWLNIMLRYGMFNSISAINASDLTPYMSPSDLLEVKMLQAIAKLQLSTQLDSDYPINDFINIFEMVTSSPNLSERIQILTLNYLVVLAYRFGIRLPFIGCLDECHQKLIGLLNKQNNHDFASTIRTSVAYRGIAMIKEIDASLKQDYLNKAEYFARNAGATNPLEQIAAKENLYTCLQTLSKWNMHIDQIDASEKNLLEMIELDPFDSTAYAEMGFFLLKQERYKDAAKYFSRATQLGPPAVGMHTYYYAKCLQAIGKHSEAINALHAAAELDEQAVSPWLDLIEHHVEAKQYPEAKTIANLILNKPIYEEQLQEDEIIKLRALVET